MKRKKREEEHENHERWLVSYADFITLLFAFFTTLYAISQVDAKKLGNFVESLQVALNQKVKIVGHSSEPSVFDRKAALVAPITIKKGSAEGSTLQKLKEKLDRKLSGTRAGKSVKTFIDRRGIVITITDTILFDSGSDVIRKSAIPVMDGIAPTLKNIPNQIRVEGHTDDTPINNARFHSNWELSTARATSIIRDFIEHYGFPPLKLSAAGYGEYRPVKPNDTLADKAANRRVDIVILNSESGCKEPSLPSQAAPK